MPGSAAPFCTRQRSGYSCTQAAAPPLLGALVRIRLQLPLLTKGSACLLHRLRGHKLFSSGPVLLCGTRRAAFASTHIRTCKRQCAAHDLTLLPQCGLRLAADWGRREVLRTPCNAARPRNSVRMQAARGLRCQPSTSVTWQSRYTTAHQRGQLPVQRLKQPFTSLGPAQTSDGD